MNEQFNPYINQRIKINKKYKTLISENNNLKKDILWYGLRNFEDLYNNKRVIEKKKAEKDEEIKILNLKLTKSISEQQGLLKEKSLLLFFSSKQKGLRLRLDQLEESIARLKTNINARMEVSARLLIKYNKVSTDFLRYDSINEKQLTQRLIDNGNIVNGLYSELNDVSRKAQSLDEKLKPVIDRIKKTQAEIDRENRIVEKAKLICDRFDGTNSYEKAMLHKECEKELGESNPNTIIRKKTQLIQKYDRDLSKNLSRAQKISKNAIREIDHIIIDGNNLCYENSDFIGLKVLKSLSSVICSRYNTTIIFDASIRHLLKMNDESIKKGFDENIKIHIVATKQTADEIVLNLASEDSKFYVLSNDRFAEYSEKSPVKYDRVLRHEIIGNHVMIQDLDINMKA